ADGFLCAKLNEAEVLADAGLTDVFIANEIIGPLKVRRLAELARRAQVRVCVDDAANVDDLSRAATAAGVNLGVLVELDLGMRRWRWPGVSTPVRGCVSSACRATRATSSCCPTRRSAAPKPARASRRCWPPGG